MMKNEHTLQSVFFYGLFMDKGLLMGKGLFPSDPIVAYLDGYGLRIGARATLVKSPNERTYGTVMQLDEGEINLLYAEQSVADYIPEQVAATDLHGDALPAITYILPSENPTGSNHQYARALTKVARKCGLPREYIEEIEQWR